MVGLKVADTVWLPWSATRQLQVAWAEATLRLTHPRITRPLIRKVTLPATSVVDATIEREAPLVMAPPVTESVIVVDAVTTVMVSVDEVALE